MSAALENTQMNYETLRIEFADGIARVILNRPEKRNAMNPQMHRDMTHALEELRYDERAKVLVFTGAGPAFCGGMDLKEVFVNLKGTPEYDRVGRMAVEWRGRTLRFFPKPTIAMVNGFCFGGAFSFVEGCDLAIAAEEATFGLSEINFRLFPGGGVSKALANLLRPRDALFYGLTGRQFDGRKAAEIGLVNLAVPLSRLEAETMDIAREIAAKDPHALRATKDAYRFSLEMSWDAAINYAFAKENDLTLEQRGAWKDAAIPDFLEGRYKPGLQSHESIRKDPE